MRSTLRSSASQIEGYRRAGRRRRERTTSSLSTESSADVDEAHDEDVAESPPGALELLRAVPPLWILAAGLGIGKHEQAGSCCSMVAW